MMTKHNNENEHRGALQTVIENAVCPKSDRCIFGDDCPHGYEPINSWYGCFTRGKLKTKIEDCSRADLIEIIKIAGGYSPIVKAAIEKGLIQLEQRRGKG